MPDRDGVDEIVEQWRRERPELDTTAMAVFGRIYRAAKRVGDAQEQAYAEFGITRADFDVLATLRRAGTPDGMSPGRLTSALMLTSGGMTSRLDRLERAGLVARRPDPEDRRALLVTLTPAGRELIDRAVVAGLEVQQRLLGDLSADKQRRVDDLLRELLSSVERHA
ncbi:MarR family transcriptional regulator [Blastococcus sp. MG754426]|uniref:MarR family winged helix-turn-helix transcriptional regulator n=1 Tax=unclassified Blastococcus TaxID=2619396 RepID=UPI001EF15786|nr:MULTISPECIES: MarR family transcriptional regulator [unclassified Blastococcus]MCF6506612.1 MarR family transcriptional regulator [Blastococcus sp. MG754426]MCF6510324.1 MarR family transcriptional regulator [Blastococcus sp. MG754427]